MPNFKFIIRLVLILIITAQINILPQDADIVPYLKQIENGNRDLASAQLPELKKKFLGSPDILFLEGVLTIDGRQAVNIYSRLLKKYPKSRYADASLYRISAYYYAIGKYSEAADNLRRLKKEYPQSPYIKLAERDIPAKDITVSDNKNIVPVKKEVVPEDNGNYKYTIQAGAFTVEANANSLKSDLDSAGYYTRIEDKPVGGTTFHIIYVGKFVNQEDANGLLKIINDKYSLSGRIVSINTK